MRSLCKKEVSFQGRGEQKNSSDCQLLTYPSIFISQMKAGCCIARHPLACESAGSALSNLVCLVVISFMNVSHVVLRLSMGLIVAFNLAGKSLGVIQSLR